MKIQELRKLIKEELEKHYYNDRETWIEDTKSLPAADDGPNFVKNPEGKLIAYWDDELEQGWIKK